MSEKSIILTRSKKKQNEKKDLCGNLALAFENATQSLFANHPKRHRIELINCLRQHTGHCLLHLRFTGERGCTIGWQDWSYGQIDMYAESDCVYSSDEYAEYENYFFRQ